MERPHSLRTILFSLVLACSILGGCSRSTAVATEATDSGRFKDSLAARSEPRVFLWEIRSRTATVYLLGSIHLATPDLYPLDPRIEAAFAEASVLAVEADTTGPDSAQAMAGFMDRGVYKDGSTLSDHLSEPTLELLDTYLESRQFPRSMLETMKPWLAAMTLSVLEFQRLGYEAAYGIDQHFLSLARNDGKTIRELESVAFLIDLLAGFSSAEQDAFLAYTLAEAQDLGELADSMLTAWRAGDTSTMESLVLRYDDDPRMRPIVERMLFERNVGMAETIRGYLEQPGTHFVVAGAAHLPGARGILDLLERDGAYRIRQLTAAKQPAGKP